MTHTFTNPPQPLLYSLPLFSVPLFVCFLYFCLLSFFPVKAATMQPFRLYCGDLRPAPQMALTCLWWLSIRITGGFSADVLSGHWVKPVPPTLAFQSTCLSILPHVGAFLRVVYQHGRRQHHFGRRFQSYDSFKTSFGSVSHSAVGMSLKKQITGVPMVCG